MKRKKHKRIDRIFLLLLLLTGIYLLFSFTEHHIVPTLKEISHMQCKTLANQIIDSSVIEILDERDLTDGSAFVSYSGNEGYTANTTFVNIICSDFSNKITEDLQSLPNEKIGIPLGAVLHLDYFANKGPYIPFTLMPMGKATVDYESQILSVGINQINYKIWLDISIELKIVNPLYDENVTLERKIMLADIVFSGKVPDHYFQLKSPDEYLLTE
ncbi:MAG: sporulation protein YunB [Anaerotignum sp.]|nr:sporulation protein YunB [Anaerotignum sp.]